MVAILELNDHQIKLTQDEQQINSSGYCTIDGQQLLFGQQAQAQFRRQPRVSYNQYWQQLNVEPIETGNPKLRHHADFVHQQLMDLHQQQPFEQVILSLPASFSHEQIGLLLGICQQCPFEVKGIIDSSIAAVANQPNIGEHLYLDIQLHQCILTKINITDHIKVVSTDIISGTGISQLFQRFANILTQEFIHQCRFDPMHNADSEQQLYDLFGSLLNQNQQEDSELTLEGRQINLNRQSLIRQASPLFDSVFEAIKAAGHSGNIYISERVAQISELYQPLKQRSSDTLITVKAENLAKTCKAQQAQICDHPQGLVYTNQLIVAQTAKATKTKAPTHLLFEHSAYALAEQAWYLNYNQGKLTLAAEQDNPIAAIKGAEQPKLQVLGAVKVNGVLAKDIQTLNRGDVISPNSASAQQVTLIDSISHQNTGDRL